MGTRLHELQLLIGQDEKFLFTATSFVTILLILLNLFSITSPVIGALASVVYFVINAIFLERFFPRETNNFLRFMLGSLLLVLILGLTSWMMLIIYNLDVIPSATALIIVTILSSFLNRRSKKRTTPSQESSKEQKHDDRVEKPRLPRFPVLRLLYIGMAVSLFCLLLASRSGEVYTVWQGLHPMFILTYFATTLLLVVTLFSSERTEYKVLFVIIHSILSHSFFVMIFPAGDISGQQLILGVTRRIYNNDFFHGYGGSAASVIVRMYNWVKGTNFQSAYSVIFARMFSVDVFWTHVLLVPLLWSTFVPLIIFKITKTISGNETVSALSSLLISAFPEAIVWGTWSVTNSLGFIFTLSSIYFMLRYISKNDKSLVLAIVFTFASLISHYMTGVVTFSLLVLAIAWKTYQTEKAASSLKAKYTLFVSFLFGASLLPIALVYHRFFSPNYARFTLDRLYEQPASELIGTFLFGAYFNYGPLAIPVFALGPLLGCIGMFYTLRRSTMQHSVKHALGSLFLATGFLMILTDYRILKLFMVDVPFSVERLWVLRDFLLIPYTAIFVYSLLTFLKRKTLPNSSIGLSPLFSIGNPHGSWKHIALCSITLITISGWITTSLYYAYPHYSPLQITSYEIEAIKYIKANTSEPYAIIGDMWITQTISMFIGVPYNPQATALFIEMIYDPSPATMIKAMEQTNATIAYFIIQKLRLGEEKYSSIIFQAIQNDLQTYQTFDYQGQEKLYIFIYQK